MLPKEKYIINIPPPQIRFKQNTIRRCNFRSNCSPFFCFNVFSPNFEILFLITTSARSQSVSLEIYVSIRLSNGFLSAQRPSSCGIFGYRPATSTVHKILLSGNSGKERSLFKKSFVSLIYDLTACAVNIRFNCLLMTLKTFQTCKI